MKLKLNLMTLGMFVIGTDGYVIAGILPQLAGTAHVSVGVAGQLITVFALCYAVFSPLTASLFGRMDRKRLLMLALCIFAVGNVIFALAPSYAFMALGRVVAAFGASAYTPVAMTITGAISPQATRGKAIAYLNAGMTTATVIGVPIGTLVGDRFGYRVLFTTISLLALLSAVVILLLFDPLPSTNSVPLRKRLAALALPGVVPTVLVSLFVFVGAFTMYSYVSQWLKEFAHMPDSMLSVALFAFGLGGMLGNWAGGRLIDHSGVRLTVTLSSGLLAAVFLLMRVFGGSPVAAFVLTLVWGACGWLLAPAQQYRLMQLGGEHGKLLVSLNASAMYLGIGTSGVTGALSINLLGVQNLPLVGMGFALAALILTVIFYGRRKAVSVG